MSNVGKWSRQSQMFFKQIWILEIAMTYIENYFFNETDQPNLVKK